MIEQEIVEKPDLAQLATVTNPKTKGTNQVTKKKKASSWPLLLFGAGGILYYLWDKKKKTQAQQAQAQAQYQNQILPPVKKTIVHTETSGSTESRLAAMGEGYKGSNPTARQEWKEL